jgi:hypothetical protein
MIIVDVNQRRGRQRHVRRHDRRLEATLLPQHLPTLFTVHRVLNIYIADRRGNALGLDLHKHLKLGFVRSR